MLCSRQSGKSTVAAALAVREALLSAPALILIVSRSQRQSGELYKQHLKPIYNALGRPVGVVQETALTMELANGSRVVCLPGDEETIRCYSGVRLLILDEAARVPDQLYFSVRPMLAVSRGILVALSTPFGKRGWFYEEWSNDGSRWTRAKVPASECPRLTPAVLEEERRVMGDWWFSQEYGLEFRDTVDSLFLQSDIDATLDNDLQPLVLD
jgi:hypothetical protein